MPTQATLKDVARLSGVSVGTVDRVIHNRGKVSEANKQAVLCAIQALDYHPSQIARALVTRKNNLKIGVCLPQVEGEFWAEGAIGVNTAKEDLLPFGVELVVESTYTYADDDLCNAVKRLLSKDVNAIVLLPNQGLQSHLDDAIPENIPYATVIEDIPSSRRLFHLGPDNIAMGRLAGRLATLYAPKGHESVILAGNLQFIGTQQRISGFRNRLQEIDPTAKILGVCEVSMASEMDSYQSAFEIAKSQLELYPNLDLIYVTNGLTQWAATAVKQLHRQGQVHVIGYEYTNMTPSFMHEGIISATIYQRPAQQWYHAIYKMYEYLVGETTIEDPIIRSRCDIIMEESLPLLNIGDISIY